MTVAEITPQMMFDRADEASNTEDQGTRAGRMDALLHVAWVITADERADGMEKYQDENLNPANSSEAYIAAYSATWKALYHMI